MGQGSQEESEFPAPSPIKSHHMQIILSMVKGSSQSWSPMALAPINLCVWAHTPCTNVVTWSAGRKESRVILGFLSVCHFYL